MTCKGLTRAFESDKNQMATKDLFEELPSEEDVDRELEDLLSDSYWSGDGDMDSEDTPDNESGLWTVDSLTIFLSDLLSVDLLPQ